MENNLNNPINPNNENTVDIDQVLEAMKEFEIKAIEKKYSRLQTRRNVKEVFRHIENAGDKEYLLDNLDSLIELASDRAGIDENLVRTYLYINRNLSFKYNATVEEAEEIAGEILFKGISVCQNHIFYTDKSELIQVAKGIVENKIREPEYLKKFLSKEDLSILLAYNSSKEKIVDTLFLMNEVEDLLELDTKIVFHTSDTDEVYCSYLPYK